MRNLVIVTAFMSVVCINAFGGGTGSGAGPGRIEISRPTNKIFYMKKQASELVFAITDGQKEQLDIHSLRPEEILDSEVVEALRRSKKSKRWESIQSHENALDSVELATQLKSLNGMKLGN